MNKVVQKWLIPLSPSDIRSFLNLDGYYRRLVEGFSSISLTLITLIEKKVTIKWCKACEKTYQDLKTFLTSAPILTLSEGFGGLILYCDASRIEFGCVLRQHSRVIVYTLRQLNVHENKYCHMIWSLFGLCFP